MKKLVAILLLICVSIQLLCGCAPQSQSENETTQPAFRAEATEADIAHLESLYQGKEAAHGDTHGHTASSEYSDGRQPMSDWKTHMQAKFIDFVSVVDHRQTLHMRHEEWDDSIFIGGTEIGAQIIGTEVLTSQMQDGSMLFADVEAMEAVLNAFPVEYQYYDGRCYNGPRADHERMAEIIQCIKDNGGLYVSVHPLCEEYYDPVDPMNYWFADETGFEVCNSLLGDYSANDNLRAYACWVDMLNAGKRIWAFSGSDSHTLPYIFALVTVYAAEQNNQGYLDQLRVGNLTAGPVGIRMAVGDAVTGSVGSFADNRVVISVGDFHKLATDTNHTYRLDIYDETGLIASQDISTMGKSYFAFDADANAKYYRANVYDVTADKIFAVGNPVWNG